MFSFYRSVFSAILLLPLLASVTACAPMSRIGEEAKGLGGDIREHSMNIATIIQGKDVREHVRPVSYSGQRFCYRTQSDILCYTDPLPGQEQRLVGYQLGKRPQTAVNTVSLPQIEPVAVQAAPAMMADSPSAETPFSSPNGPISLMQGVR